VFRQRHGPLDRILPHPVDQQEFGLVARRIGAGPTRAAENELDVRQIAIAPSRHAPEKAQIGPIDQLRRDIVGITSGTRSTVTGPSGLGYVAERVASSGSCRSRSVSGRRAAHRMTSRPPIYVRNAAGTRTVPSSCW
jgi:hypothetical protein